VAFTEADWAAIPSANVIFARVSENRLMHHEDPSTAIHDQLAPQPGDPDAQTRDVLRGKVFPRRARVIDTAELRTLLQGS